MICGLTTDEIARAFLLPEATIAQRIVRAKRTLSESGLAYETPRGEELSERLASVLEVVYLIFNEGYTAARGDDWLRPQLCDEALRMGRVLTSIAPQEPEVHGLMALDGAECLAEAARTDAAGEPILLWTRTARAGTSSRSGAAFRRSARARTRRCRQLLRVAGRDHRLSCDRRVRPHATDWPRIAALYAQLAALARSPIIELNRAVAVGMAEGPQAGLAMADRLAARAGAERTITFWAAFAATFCTSSADLTKPAPPSRWRPALLAGNRRPTGFLEAACR